MRERTMVTNEFQIEAFHRCVDQRLPEDYVYVGESHDCWEILYVVEGEVEVTEDDTVYAMSEGDLILHAPMVFHRDKSSGGTSPNICNLSFWTKGEYPKESLTGVFHLDQSERKEYLSICKSSAQFIAKEVEGEYVGQEIACRLTAFMLHLSRTYQAQHRKVSNERALVYKRLVEIMHEEVFNNVSIAQVAEKLFVSVSYVKVLFNRYAGISPKSYYTNLQITEAMKMLSEGKNVRDVAERMNFSTPSYFSVFFKKNTGMSPKRYKDIKR